MNMCYCTLSKKEFIHIGERLICKSSMTFLKAIELLEEADSLNLPNGRTVFDAEALIAWYNLDESFLGNLIRLDIGVSIVWCSIRITKISKNLFFVKD